MSQYVPPGIKPSQNGQATGDFPLNISLVSPTSHWPPIAPTRFSHILSKEEGLAAPGDFVSRPDHPTLGGVLYASSPPARDSRYILGLTDHAYRLLREEVPLREAGLRIAQDDARHATQIVRETLQSFQDELKAGLQAAQDARADFPYRAAEVQNAMAQATAPLRETLKPLDAEIAQMQRLAMRAHSQIGVPRAVRITRTVAPSANSVEEGKAQPVAAKEKLARGNPEEFSPLWIKISKCFLGTTVGLAFGMSKSFLKLYSLLRFEPSVMVWMAFWMVIGTCAVTGLTGGLWKWWKYAGERCAEEPAFGGLCHWHAMRHAFFPLLVTCFVGLMEASLLRNAQVASPLVRDPGNWMYLVGNLALILPVTLHAGASGWTHGYTTRMKTLAVEREEIRQQENHACLEQTIIMSAPAQAAFALDDYVETLQKRRAPILAAIAETEAPYRTLLAHYVAQMEATTTLSNEQRKIADAMREDAKAANLLYKQKHSEYENAFEPLPSGATPGSLTLCFVRNVNGELVSLPAPKKSLWQRLTAFFGRLRKQLSRSKKEETA